MGGGSSMVSGEPAPVKTSNRKDNEPVRDKKVLDSLPGSESPASDAALKKSKMEDSMDSGSTGGIPSSWWRIPEPLNDALFPTEVFGPVLYVTKGGKRLPDWSIFEEDTSSPSFYLNYYRANGKLRRRLSVMEMQEASAKYRAGELERLGGKASRSKEVTRESLGAPVDPEDYIQSLHEYLRYAKNTYRFIDNEGEMCRLYETPSWHQLKHSKYPSKESRGTRPTETLRRTDEQRMSDRDGFNPAAFYVKSKFEPEPILKGNDTPLSRNGSQTQMRAAVITSPSKIRSRVSFSKDTEYHPKTKSNFLGGAPFDENLDELPVANE